MHTNKLGPYTFPLYYTFLLATNKANSIYTPSFQPGVIIPYSYSLLLWYTLITFMHPYSIQ